jgi:cold shock CspA family protein
MREGIIRRYYPEKGFGFIRGDDGREAFLHIHQAGHLREPKEGQRVRFETGNDPSNGRLPAVTYIELVA